MEFSRTLRFRSPQLHPLNRKLVFPVNLPRNHRIPAISLPIRTTTKLQNRSLTVTAKMNSRIEGLSEELNSIASLNLDHAAARRRVRSAFSELQQQLDHPLFMVGFIWELLRLICLPWFDFFSSQRWLIFYFFLGSYSTCTDWWVAGSNWD